MKRTRIELPGKLHLRVKDFAAQHGLSFSEVIRRALDAFLPPLPQVSKSAVEWKLPTVRCGKIKVPLSKLHEISYEDQIEWIARGMPRVERPARWKKPAPSA